jgi:hypothetical protein
VQLEFGGTQLWFPPAKPGGPPSTLIAVRLQNPLVAAFLTAKGATLQDGWPEAMGRDEYEPFTVDHEQFTLTSVEAAADYLAAAGTVKAIIGTVPGLSQYRARPMLAFWAGPVGFVGMAESMALYSVHGEFELTAVPELSRKWWAYWKEYWARKDTADPMPEDYACEVTIPIAGD